MSDTRLEMKESRRILRCVQTHRAEAHLSLGVRREPIGLVDVIYHPTSTLPHLNYVSPRKKTAWVPGPEIEKGLNFLREKDRKPRVFYIEGLYPPLFAKSLRGLGLLVEAEIPLMAHTPQDAPRYQLLSEMHVEEADTHEGVAMWWYVWRNAYYDVITGGTEPVYIGQDMQRITLGQQVDLVLSRYGFPVGVVRLTLYEKIAHISAIAIMKEERTPEMIELAHRIALRTAVLKGCQLVFTSGETERNRDICRKIGFIDSGSIVCYAESTIENERTHHDDHVGRSVFMLRR